MRHPQLLFICLAATLFGRAALGAEIGLPDKLEFLTLLEQGEFETLDRRLSAYQEAFEEGRIPDTLVDYAFSTFANSRLSSSLKYNAELAPTLLKLTPTAA